MDKERLEEIKHRNKVGVYVTQAMVDELIAEVERLQAGSFQAAFNALIACPSFESDQLSEEEEGWRRSLLKLCHHIVDEFYDEGDYADDETGEEE